MAHVAQLSGGVAMARDRVRRMIAVAGNVDAAWRAGELGVEQARLLGRVYANVRVHDQFLEQQDWFLRRAGKYAYVRFERAVGDWVSLHDQDGTEPDDRAHANRDAKLIQDHFSRGWHFEARGPSLTGAVQREIFDAYIEAEFAIDWEQAVALHGEAVCLDLLARTDAQRRYDAFHQMCLDAANNPNSSTGSKIVHNIVWDHATFEEMVARLAGAEPKPVDPDMFRCSTVDGHRIDPHEAIIDAITNQIRRVVVDAKNVVIDMGQARFFTGLARLASRIGHDECEWIGCHVPASRCEADHMHPHAKGGRTDQDNNTTFCRRHNRVKEKGYTVHRDPDGQLQIISPRGETLR